MSNVITRPYSDIDKIAAKLAYIGRLGRRMPPSWDGARISVPVCSPHGEYVGRVLPGRGLFMEVDPKEIGITKPMPYVYPKTTVLKLRDAFEKVKRIGVCPERAAVAAAAMVAAAYLTPRHLIAPLIIGAITNYDGIINARGAATGAPNDVAITKVSLTTVANQWSSLWQSSGVPPSAGTYTNIPGGAAPDNSNAAAWSLGLGAPTGGNKVYILTFGYTAAQVINMGILLDLLIGAGNITTNVTTGAQTVNSTALTRYTSGAGVLMTFDITTALGASAANITVTYTNQAGTGSRSTGAQALLASGIVQRLTPVGFGPFIDLQSGDFGVQSVQSATVSALMGAGVIALNLYFPQAFVPGVLSNAYIERDSTTQIDGLVQLAQSSGAVLGCLNMYVQANGTSTGVLTAFLRTCQG